MKRMGILKALTSGLACLGMIVPTFDLQAGVNAGTPRPQTAGRDPVRIDVMLQHDGVLSGEVVGTNGKRLSGMPVSLRSSDGKVTNIVTDQSGRFRVSRLRNGTYQIVAGPAEGSYGIGVYRIWDPASAPPSARQSATVRVVRGQGGSLLSCLGNPWVILGIIATAVAIPVAIHNSKKPASP